jgi:hypothetical protein
VKRPARIPPNAATVLSLVLRVLTLGAWLRSHPERDDVACTSPITSAPVPIRYFQAVSAARRLSLEWGTHDIGDLDPVRRAQWDAWRTGLRPGYGVKTRDLHASDRGDAFALDHGQEDVLMTWLYASATMWRDDWEVCWPHGFLVALTAPLPLLTGVQRFGKRRTTAGR